MKNLISNEPKLVIVESPYAGNIKRNTIYARRAIRDSILLGESPFASHLLYPQPGVLNENDPEERQLGIGLGYDWWRATDFIAFYVDYGWSPGMEAAKMRASSLQLPIVFRTIGQNHTLPLSQQLKFGEPDVNQSNRSDRIL